MIKQILLIVCIFITYHQGKSQNDISFSDTEFQYGIAAKLSVEIGYRFYKKFALRRSNFYTPGYRLSVTGGIGYDVKGDIGFFPALHTGIMMFNKGSIGADQSQHGAIPQFHVFASTIVAVELDKKDFSPLERSVPFYHFAEFTANPIQNPYKSSISYGANWIRVQKGAIQRVGFFNLNVLGRAQVSYYNDGGPVLGWAGDNRDRYYTGGLVISYHGNIKDAVDLIELSYHKYTGYQKYAFDVADKLQIDYLNYNDTNQFAYNQQRWRLNVSNINSGYGGHISLFNVNRIDFQDYLHFKTNVPYHPDYYKGYRIMFGGRFEYNKVNIPQ
ncbi:hypothetical protein [Aquimarina sp. MMG016]|uniref:hypothetical protein n=1 Tax=Aquimarina sp. MMG016 TaxID=2822690 RepID=UPI001B3A5D04|nr:hypothetical protein [Aquimarina sp. MMG016]MBQ4819623.1 hypothetical protein [Aquimarina sp. MMG016]